MGIASGATNFLVRAIGYKTPFTLIAYLAWFSHRVHLQLLLHVVVHPGPPGTIAYTTGNDPTSGRVVRYLVGKATVGLVAPH